MYFPILEPEYIVCHSVQTKKGMSLSPSRVGVAENNLNKRLMETMPLPLVMGLAYLGNHFTKPNI